MTRDDIIGRLGKLTDTQREAIRAAAAGCEPVLRALDEFSRLPTGTTYEQVRGDLAYIDNFDSAPYDVFRRELHLIFEDGHEAALPISQVLQPPPVLDPKTQQLVTQLQKNDQLMPPTSNAAGGAPGQPGFISVIGTDVYYNDPRTGLLRPQHLRAALAPRLYQAVADLDPATQ